MAFTAKDVGASVPRILNGLGRILHLVSTEERDTAAAGTGVAAAAVAGGAGRQGQSEERRWVGKETGQQMSGGDRGARSPGIFCLLERRWLVTGHTSAPRHEGRQNKGG